MYCSKEEDCGYDLEFIENAPDTLICIICNLVLRNPVQIMACGHRFCSGCFQRMKNYSVRMNTNLCCPIDREIIDTEKVFKDTGIARDIGGLKVKCSNNQNGCSWEGEIRNLKVHLNTCEAKKNSRIPEKMTEETGNLFSQILQRITKCEEDLLKKEKEIACLKLNVNEIKSENIRKDAELVEIGKKLTSLRENNLHDLLQKEKEIASLKVNLNVVKRENLYNDTKLVENGKELKSFKESNSQYEEEIKKLKEENKLYDWDEVIYRIQNIEKFLFYTDAEPETMTCKWKVVYKWKLINYQYSCNNFPGIRSPIFDVLPFGYRYRIGVKWGGENKKDVALFFQLYKGYNVYKEPFSMYVLFEIIDKYGNMKKHTITPNMIGAERECFTVPPGQKMCKKIYKFECVLTMPADEAYIIDDALTITCCITPAT